MVSALCWAIAAEVLVVIVRFEEGEHFAVLPLLLLSLASALAVAVGAERKCVVVEEECVSWGRLARPGSIAI